MDGNFPDRLNYLKAKCVLKKAGNYCVYNYRPVSLYEVLTQRVPFKNNTLNLEKVYSQSLIQIYRWNRVLSWIKCRSLYDLAKPFDCVNREITMQVKLQQNFFKLSENNPEMLIISYLRTVDQRPEVLPTILSGGHNDSMTLTLVMSMLFHWRNFSPSSQSRYCLNPQGHLTQTAVHTT